MSQPRSIPDESGRDELVEAVVGASRVLVAIAARSLVGRSDDITLPQYRLLVVLATGGPQRIGELAANLDVNPSTATRLCDRLERKGLVAREQLPTDRRVVQLAATHQGHDLVIEVMDQRRAEVSRILATMTTAQHRQVAEGLRLFSRAAGRVPDRHWTVGWHPA